MDELITLALLVLLQAVLGFDNLLYISLESKRAPKADRARVRKLGIALAIVLRIVLLLVLVKLVDYFQDPVMEFHGSSFMEGAFSVHSMIVLAGGAFILYTAVKEIWHMISLEADHGQDAEPRSAAKVITWIVVMNLVFSFDSILSAMALTETFWVMATAIVISGVLMIMLADRVSQFLQKNRMYEVLGLFVLFIVGVMLLTEGGHLAHLSFFGQPIEQMSKTTFYFVITVLVLVDFVQARYQKRLDRLAQARIRELESAKLGSN
ncbi:MAG: putative tellurium resistance membrane protein TerC [Planctomycetota bacterium]|jgi:predicted tellurium resistance membrane protein TerC